MIRFNKNITYTQQRIFFFSILQFVCLGLPPLDALECLAKTSNIFLRKFAQLCIKSIRLGHPLSSTLHNVGYKMDQPTLALLRAGETSGNLEQSLRAILEHIKKTADFKNSLVAVLRYPVLLLTLLVVIFYLLCATLFPSYVMLFQESGRDLPFVLYVFSRASFLLQHKSFLLLNICFFGSVSLIFFVYIFVEKVRFCLSYACIKLPFLGNLFLFQQWWVFFYTFSLCSKASIASHKGFALAVKGLRSRVLQRHLCQSLEGVKKGRMLSNFLVSVPGILPEVSTLLLLAERSQSHAAYEQIAILYEEKLLLMRGLLLAYLGPILLSVLGLCFTWLVTSLMLPFYEQALTLSAPLMR